MRRGKRVAREPQGELIEHEAERVPREPMALVPASVSGMIELALKKGGTEVAEVIERLTRLHQELADKQSARDLAAALSRFKAGCPPIPRTSQGEMVSERGRYKWSYADLEQIAETIAPLLRSNGLSFSWDVVVNDSGATMTVTCILSHENGASMSRSFAVPTESRAGMSPQQKYAAAAMFGKRQSLIQVLGLVTADVPEEAARELDPTPCSEEQAATLAALAEEVGADMTKFLAYLRVEKLGDLPARRYGEAVAALESKRRRA